MLRAKRFSDEFRPLVENFDCGDEEWCVELNGWISGGLVIESIENKQTSVWLYVDETVDSDGKSSIKLVGYGSLGPSNWRLREKEPRVNITIIPCFALAKEYRGKSIDGVRCSEAIMEDLIAKAKKNAPDILGLYVHERNQRAIDLYKRLGFQALPGTKDNHVRMFLNLRD